MHLPSAFFGLQQPTRREWIRARSRGASALALVALHAALLVPGLPGSSGVAHAAPPGGKPTIVLLPLLNLGDAVAPQVVGRIDEYFRTLASMDGTMRVVEPGAATVVAPAPVPAYVPAPSAEPMDKDTAAAFKAVDAARPLLASKKFAPAAKKIDQAIGKVQIAKLDDFDRYVDAQLLLAVARFGQGYDDDGEELLSQVLVMRPDLQIDPQWDLPSLRAAADRLRAAIQQVPTGTLQVVCPDPNCVVHVDGRPQGAGSAMAAGLPRGLHWIRVVTPGYEPFAARVSTPPAGETRAITASSKRSNAAPSRVAAPVPPRAPPVSAASVASPSGALMSFVREGAYTSGFLTQASAYARQSGASHVVATVVNRSGEKVAMGSFVFSDADQKVAEISGTTLSIDASDLQVRVLAHQEQVSAAVHRFPVAKAVRATPPLIYTVWQRPAAVGAVVAIAPTPFTPAPFTPAPIPVAPPPISFTPAPIPIAPAPPPNIFPTSAPPPIPGIPQPYNPTPVYTPQPVYAPPPAIPGVPTAAPSPYSPYPSPAPVTPSVMRTTDPTVAGYVEEDDSEPVYKKWWFWTVLGVLVVGGATTAGVLLAPSDAPAPQGFSTNVRFE